MEEAAASFDFEPARRLRDEISLLRRGASIGHARGKIIGLQRQQPGSMEFGMSQQRMMPSSG